MLDGRETAVESSPAGNSTTLCSLLEEEQAVEALAETRFGWNEASTTWVVAAAAVWGTWEYYRWNAFQSP